MSAPTEIMVAMRDGVQLATDVYLPPGSGPFPVLLERTPYDKRGTRAAEISVADRTPQPQAQLAAQFVAHGYAVVIQDCRGRHRSEGHFEKYVGEAPDGFDTLAWIAQQPWSTGRVGMFGLSYCAHVQMAAASLAPPALAAMLLDSGGFSDAFQGGIRQGGAFELKQATWAFNHAKQSRAAEADPLIKAALDAQDIKAWFARLPWKPGHSPLAALPEYESYMFEQWREECDSDYWKQPGLNALAFLERIPDIPILLMSSWYDPYPRTATDNFVALKRAGRSAPLWLVLGPWMHGRRSERWSGDADFGDDATLDGALAQNYLDFRLRFFDSVFFPQRAPQAPVPAVRYFRMGGGPGRRTAEKRLAAGGQWMETSDWPPQGTRDSHWYLHADGGMATEPDGAATSLEYDFDPDRPVPSIGGTITSGAPIMEGGAFDQRESPRFFGARAPFLPLASRADVLVFETAPLDRDLEITGPIAAELYVSCSTPDTDLTIKLIDVYPPSPDDPEGFAMNVADGIQRLRFRDGYAAPRLMTPGHIYRVRVEAFPTSILFKAGHKMRLDVSSSNFPHFDVNPNTGAPAWRAGPKAVARVTLHLGGQHASRLILPASGSAKPLKLHKDREGR
jgi:putative CocE/NonD family hydrolase